LNLGRCEDDPFSVMGSYNVDLSIRGCATNIQRRLCSRGNFRHESDSRNVDDSRNTDVDSDCHGHAVVNIIAAVLLFGVNIAGVPGYPGAYDKFLIVVSLGFNILTVWYAWKWV
jgi:hypothetical protein